MGKIFTSADIDRLYSRGEGELRLSDGDRLTDLAREMANGRGIRIVTGEARPAPQVQQSRSVVQPHWNGQQLQMAARPAAQVYDLVVKGGICVIPEIGCIETNVCIRGGKVVALTTENVEAQKVVDATGKFVLPGIIDPHTHLGLFTSLDSELESETRSAVLGGVTTIGTYFNQTESYIPFISQLEAKVSSLSRVDMIPHLAMRTEQQIAEMDAYSALGMNSYKVYMCGVKGIYPHQEDGFILKTMNRMKELQPGANPILSVHCENTSICDYAEADMESLSLETLEDWNKTHPNIAEGEAVIRAAYLSLKSGARTYVVHSSTKEAMEALSKIKHKNLYVETTSPYLSLDTSSDIGVYGKMTPPIREPESRDALWNGVRDGIIDTIGTDNTVMTSEEKKVSKGMREAGPGYPTLGTHLVSVLNEGIFRQELPIEKLVALMTVNPARIFGIYPRKGTIMPGSDADLVLVDLNSSRTVNPRELLSRSDFSLFQGKTLRGWPCATIKGGKVVAWNGRIVDDSVRGVALRH